MIPEPDLIQHLNPNISNNLHLVRKLLATLNPEEPSNVLRVWVYEFDGVSGVQGVGCWAAIYHPPGYSSNCMEIDFRLRLESVSLGSQAKATKRA